MTDRPIPIQLVCDFKYECPKTWETLTPTADANVRHCDSCREDVTFCSSDDQFIELSRLGKCVALVVAGDPKDQPPRRLMGLPGGPRSADLRAFTDGP